MSQSGAEGSNCLHSSLLPLLVQVSILVGLSCHARPNQSERAHRLSTYLRALPTSPPGARRQNSCCEINRGPGSWWVRDRAGEIHRINSWILEGTREFNLSDFWLSHVHSVESFWRVYCRAWWLLCGAVT